MTHIEFFKMQAGNLLRDFQAHTKGKGEDAVSCSPRFFNVDQIVKDFSIDKNECFSLMKAQHIVAKIAGFKKWNDLIKATEFQLELGKLFFNSYTTKTKDPERMIKKSMVKAKLKDGQTQYFEFGKWQGRDNDVVELSCKYIDDIKDITPLSKLKNLKNLEMIAVDIKDLSVLSTLRNVENLNLSLNEITDLTPLESLNKLSYLNVSGNLIEDISPLAKCKNIKTLHIDDNMIKSLSPLTHLKNLSVLDFIYQRPYIDDLTPLSEIKGLRIAVVRSEFKEGYASFEQINERIKAGKLVSGIRK